MQTGVHDQAVAANEGRITPERQRMLSQMNPQIEVPDLSEKDEQDAPTAVLKKFKKQNTLKKQLDQEYDGMLCDITDQFRKIDKEATRENLEHQTRERGFFKASEFTHGDVMYSFGLCKDIHDEDESEIDHSGHNHDNEWDFQNLLTFPVDSSFLKFWNFFISILCLYSSYLYGWQ